MASGFDKQTIIIISVVLLIGIALTVGQILFLTLTSCRNKNDIMFMIDDSASVEDDDFQKAKNFVIQIANSPDITLKEKTVNIATASFAKKAQFMDKFPQDHYMYKKDVIQQQMSAYQRVDEDQCPTGTFTSFTDRSCTNILGALNFVDTNMIRDRSGARTLIFMTDGGSNMNGYRQNLTEIQASADRIKNKDTDVYTIRVGVNEYEKYRPDDQKEMEAISSGSVEDGTKEQYMYQVNSYAELEDLAGILSDEFCSKNYWLAAIPITVALIFVGIKLFLNYLEHKKFKRETEETAAMNRTEMR